MAGFAIGFGLEVMVFHIMAIAARGVLVCTGQGPAGLIVIKYAMIPGHGVVAGGAGGVCSCGGGGAAFVNIFVTGDACQRLEEILPGWPLGGFDLLVAGDTGDGQMAVIQRKTGLIMSCNGIVWRYKSVYIVTGAAIFFLGQLAKVWVVMAIIT